MESVSPSTAFEPHTPNMHYHLKLIKLLVPVSHYHNYGALDMEHFSVWTLSIYTRVGEG